MSNTVNTGSTTKRMGVLGWLDENFEKPFLFAAMLGVILIITFQTAYRYIVTKFSADAGAAVWTEELARFLFIWMSYLAIPLAIKNRSNIRVDIIYDRLPKRFQDISWIMVDACFLVLAGAVTVLGSQHVQMQLQFPQTTPALQVPYSIPYLILPFGFGLMALRVIQDLVKQIRVTGLLDTLIGFALCGLISLPLILFNNMNALALLFGYFILFLVIGVPIAIGLGLAALATIIGAGTLPIEYIAQIAFTSIDSFPIMAIPFFIAAGVFMGAGGLSQRLLNLADEMLGSLPGGMALATIATCMFFAAISGSGPATVAAIGSLTIPAMIERGYDKYFAAAIVACSGAIGVMIPPSNPFVVYGVSAQVSIGKLFIGGIVPGLLTGGALMFFSYVVSKKNGWKGEEKERNFKTFVKAFWDAKLALMVPVIVLGGIYGGIMTPTEAAALAAFYGLFVGVFVYRELNLKNIVPCFMDACSTSAIVIMLMAMATIFGNVMTIEQVPARIAEFMLGMTSSKIVILLMINVLLLWIGTFMEALAAIVILTPILLPIVTKVGVDPVHFGIVMVVNLALGFVTPPVGVNLFVASGVAKVKIEKLSKVVFPLLGIMLVVLLLVTYVPELSLFLTR
ncbi:TRAP transporter large permease subunit [Desulfobaculum bizertense]|uniref:C4-dicarboxylate transporter, DctM subunit n=1 Tax=Desulfobaculum bizertense DSM 18034 TaxID=1121442 RepID=A0A1T4VZ85_9BACT|nr:TRAP transporter large permease subunit [Desulfobaculum bizertense]UIJ37023.1 TRAP transporter large permease subunit [Desulfobaculum bizertense]SKA70296.1 C4-dicarboxylate transporter, DctM subunit [Desulfobaculum bizertense DSM 18034]